MSKRAHRILLSCCATFLGLSSPVGAGLITFEVLKDSPFFTQGLVVYDDVTGSLTGGFSAIDILDMGTHPDADLSSLLSGASITAIVLEYFDYEPIDSSHTLAVLDLSLTFGLFSGSVPDVTLDVSYSSLGSSGSVDLLNSLIGGALVAMLQAYVFDPNLFGPGQGDIADPVVMAMFSNTSGSDTSSGAASYRLQIGTTEIAPQPVPEPATLVLLGCGLSGVVALRRGRKKDSRAAP